VLIAGALIISLVGVLLKWRAGKQRDWVRVPGKITLSEIHRGRYFDHVCEYSYAYGGVSYRGTRVRSLQISTNWRGPAERSAATYPVAADVEVWVDPENPGESVLEPGGHKWFLPFIFFLAGIFMVIGISFASHPG
jgi:uncharacterized protein DUF3592